MRDVFVREFANPVLERLDDAATLAAPASRIAFTTDAHVVQPLVFPGGDIGTLAVAGTVNDLATAAARPLALSAAFIIEEGFLYDDLDGDLPQHGAHRAEAGVAIVTGDTKVVQRGACDGLYITTTGVGEVIVDHELGAARRARGRRRAAQRHDRRPRPGRARGARRVPLLGRPRERLRAALGPGRGGGRGRGRGASASCATPRAAA